MDKKKVIENLKQVELYINKLQGLDYTQLQLLRSAVFRLHDAQEELKKSDWISVEDELPPYEEEVLVCNKDFPEEIYMTSRSAEYEDNYAFDKYGFLHAYRVTHWCRIDKLEV